MDSSPVVVPISAWICSATVLVPGVRPVMVRRTDFWARIVSVASVMIAAVRAFLVSWLDGAGTGRFQLRSSSLRLALASTVPVMWVAAYQ